MRGLHLKNWKVTPRASLLEARSLRADQSVAVLGVSGMLCGL